MTMTTSPLQKEQHARLFEIWCGLFLLNGAEIHLDCFQISERPR